MSGPRWLTRKALTHEIGRVEDHTGGDRDQVNGHGRFRAAQYHAVHQVADALQRARAAVNFKVVDALPAHEGGEQPAEPEDVVEVTVGDEDAVETLEADARL